MYGWEIVWSPPIGSAASLYASSRSSSGTKSSRGTRSIAASTASAVMPRRRIRVLEPLHREVLAGAPRDHLVAVAAQRHLDRRLAVEKGRELDGVDAGARQEIDLPCAVRGRDHDLALEVCEARLEAGDAL